MKRTVVALVLLYTLVVSLPAAAFELTGELWSLSGQELIPQERIDNMYRGELTLIEVGPVRLMGSAQYAGEMTKLDEFINLIRHDFKEDEIAKLEDFYLLGALDGKARVDWPVYRGLSLISSIGYTVSGNIAKMTENEVPQITSRLFGGIAYSGGLGVEIAPGLTLTGTYQYVPKMKNLVGEENNAVLQGFDVKIEYQIPVVLARAGYRTETLKFEQADGYRISGFYVGVGIHF